CRQRLIQIAALYSVNSAHGIPLKGPEVRAMFRRYVEAGHHRMPDGGFKSYREIGREIGRSHPTIMKWMQSDFPKEAAHMGNEDAPAKAGGEGAPVPIVLFKHKARAALSEFLGAHEKAGYHDRQEMIDWLWSALEDMERIQGQTDAYAHDNAAALLGPGEDF
ncbi:helix-turn-helix domain-containing protein, partial [Devosia elaeis]|uniref:helix-turn-helix domain-containing protein n=1 Tax=Devosia elaeis TaxID=1770058 RepID=UPI001969E24A